MKSAIPLPSVKSAKSISTLPLNDPENEPVNWLTPAAPKESAISVVPIPPALTPTVLPAEPLKVVPLFKEIVESSTVRSFKLLPNATPETVELANFAFAIEPANIALVTPNALTRKESVLISIEESSTLTLNAVPPPPAKPSPATEVAN